MNRPNLVRLGSALAVPCLLLIPFLMTSCATPEKDYARELPEGAPALELVTDPKKMPNFGRSFENRDGLDAAMDRSLDYLSKPSSNKYYPVRGLPELTHDRAVVSIQEVKKGLQTCRSPEEFDSYVKSNFDVYRSVGWNGKGEVLFTAYCEPIVDGSRTPDARFRYPLYRLPQDLVKDEEGKCLGRKMPDGTLVPYYTRAEIDGQGLLKGKGLEVVWLDDPFKAYIVHIQGSARINLPEGNQLCLGYAGKTDRPYRSLGLHLVEKGAFKKNELSLTRLKQFFKEHPDRMSELNVNECYVFFTERDPGPYGSLGVKVTTGRTVATDKSLFPRGGIGYAVCKVPEDGQDGKFDQRLFHQFVLDQDAGGAIRSAGRADIFLGTGDHAERLAGHVHSEGFLFYIFKKNAPGAAPAASPPQPGGTMAHGDGAGPRQEAPSPAPKPIPPSGGGANSKPGA